MPAHFDSHGSADQPIEYLRFAHPNAWFEMDYPKDWEVAMDQQGAVQFAHPDYRQSLAILVFRLDLPVDGRTIEQSGQWEEIATALFSQVGSSNVRQELSIPFSCYVADRQEENEGGRRWFLLANEHVLGISTSLPVELSFQFEEVFDRMLHSLALTSSPELDILDLMNRVSAKLEAALPEWQFRIEDQKIVSEPFEISIGNLIAQIKTTPHMFSELIDQFVDGIAHAVKSQQSIGKEAWTDVQNSILPLLKSEKYVQDVDQLMLIKREGNEAGQLASQAWLDGVRVVYAIDSERTFRFVNQGDLNRWCLDVNQLHDVAACNLAQQSKPTLDIFATPEGAPKAGTVHVKTGAVSSYLLYPGLYTIAAEGLGKTLLVAIPNRDTLLFFEDHQDRNVYQSAVTNSFQSSQYAITPQLFQLTPDGVVPIDEQPTLGET